MTKGKELAGSIHLKFFQLSRRELIVLKKKGIQSLDDYIAYSGDGSEPESINKIFEPIIPYLEKDGSFDFLNYYQTLRNPPTFPCFIGKTFDEFKDEFGDWTITRLNFGKVSVWLNKQGIHDIDDMWSSFTDECFHPNGFGTTKSIELFSYLLKYLQEHQSGCFNITEVTEPTTNSLSPKKNLLRLCAKLERLSEESRSIPLTCLHIGPKTKKLHQANIVNLGNLIDSLKAGSERILNISGIGRLNLKKAINILRHIEQNIDSKGLIRWDGFCLSASIPILPVGEKIESGSSFLESIPRLINQLISAKSLPIEKSILEERLTKAVKDQKTLDQIGSEFKLTRERVRQIQKSILISLSDAFLYDKYLKLEYRISEEFSHYFKIAAAAFDESEEINV